MIDKKIVSDFADIIGNIEIAINLESFNEVKEKYNRVSKELLEWIKNYYQNKNFNMVTYDDSLEIHDLLEEIKWKLLTDKKTGDEAMLADNILIRYEIIIKKINSKEYF